MDNKAGERESFLFCLGSRDNLPVKVLEVPYILFKLMFNHIQIGSVFQIISQQTFTCSKSAAEALEKGMKYVQN